MAGPYRIVPPAAVYDICMVVREDEGLGLTGDRLYTEGNIYTL